MKFDDLTIQEKARLFKTLAQGGYLKNVKSGDYMSTVKDMYENLFASGGDTSEEPETETINASFIESRPETLRGRYKLAKNNYRNLKKEYKELEKEIKDHGIRNDEEALEMQSRINDLQSLELLKNRKKQARDDYFSQGENPNSLPHQLYRYYSRHFGYKKHATDNVSDSGSDIVDLTHDVIRATPDSKQSNLLFNEFVESKYPTVRTAKDYKDNLETLQLSDLQKFPASNVNLFAGIEDNKFVVDSLNNFKDSSTIFPVRNVKKGITKVSKIIKGEPVQDDFNKNRLRVSNLKNSTQGFTNRLNYYNYVFNDNSDGKKALELTRENFSNRSKSLERKVNRIIHRLETGKPLKNKLDRYDRFIKSDLIDNLQTLKVIPEYRPYVFNRSTVGSNPTWRYQDSDGGVYPISDYEAHTLDSKALLGNPEGSIFIGNLGRISNSQLDSLNNYLIDHPSWFVRTDLGSFDQYRQDSPSLKTYLEQYYEHPNAEDPNVFVVGTTTPNVLWDTNAYGGYLTLNPKSRIFAYGGDEEGDPDTLNSPKYKKDSERKMYDYLRYRGLNNAQTSGLLGNLAVESYLDATMQQVNGPAYGLMQAEEPRKSKIKNHPYIYSFGSGLTAEEQKQLDYIIDEGMNKYTSGEWGRKGGYKSARDPRVDFMNTDDVLKASRIISENYLRPGKPAQNRRDAMSKYYYNKIPNTYPYVMEAYHSSMWNPDKGKSK